MNNGKLPVFISYSWDSDEHRQDVKEFVQGLRLMDNLNIIYDDNMVLGDRITTFMEKSIHESDIVLFICTPQYKMKADARKGGVGYENTIITGELFASENERKFIPVLFSGTWSESLPNWAQAKLGVDLSDNEKYEPEIRKLLLALNCDGQNQKSSESEHTLRSAFEMMRYWQPIYAQSKEEADFLRRQAAGLTTPAEDAFGF